MDRWTTAEGRTTADLCRCSSHSSIELLPSSSQLFHRQCRSSHWQLLGSLEPVRDEMRRRLSAAVDPLGLSLLRLPPRRCLHVEFVIYRCDPSVSLIPSWHHYSLDLHPGGHVPMVLDALITIKSTMDPTLTFRRSCREGVCGSCAMNINGSNRLACITTCDPCTKDVISTSSSSISSTRSSPMVICPLPHQPVIRDLVVDLSVFFESHHGVHPWLEPSEPQPSKPTFPYRSEYLQSPIARAMLDGSYECILCACCSTACPPYWWQGGGGGGAGRFIGPAAALTAYRWIVDTRDGQPIERLEAMALKTRDCHTIMNCAEVCPKHLNPGMLIQRMRLAQRRTEHSTESTENTDKQH